MRKLYLSLLTILFTFLANAQTISSTTYPMTISTGAVLENMSGASTAVTAPTDDAPSSQLLFGSGFEFVFGGTVYNSFSVSPDGWLTLGRAGVNAFTNDLASTNNYPIIAPYWDELHTGTDGGITYKIVGSAPNRKFVVNWFLTIPRNIPGSANANFQVWLHESTGVIEFVYDNIVASTSNYSVGMAATIATIKQIAAVTMANPVTASTVAYVTTSPNNSNSSAIASGSKISFTPNAPTGSPANLTFTAVGPGGMTLNWTDNATDEVGYVVYRSTDNINYTLISQLPANSTSLVQTGLYSNTLYYYKVAAVSEGVFSSFINGSQLTTTCGSGLNGIIPVGPTGTYATLTAAISALNTNGLAGPVVLELEPTYTSAGETFPLAFNLINCVSSTNTITVRPQSGATALSITSANTTATIDMNGAQRVIIDGRPGGTGTASELKLINTSTAGVAIRFINDALNNIITYVDVQGQNTTAPTTGTVASAGVIYFSTGIDLGNDNNTISNCSIHGTTGGTPAIGIFSIGNRTSDASYNDDCIISGNKIYDFFSAGSASSGIKIDGGNNAWTITGNSVYQTASRTYTSANTHRGFWITPNTASISSTASGFIITDNFIGGTAANAGGTAYTMSGSVANVFNAMDISVGLGAVTSVQNNTVKNFTISTTSGAFIGISQANGNVNIGTVTGNTVGATTGTGAITVTTTASGGGTVIGYRASGGSGTINISNNSVGAITTNGTTSVGVSIIGISVTGGGTINVTNNTIGSNTTPLSINANASTTGSTQSVTGISVTGGTTTSISGNTIANLNNNYTGTSTGVTRGIFVSFSASSITGNTVRNLGTLSTSANTGVSSAIGGIVMSSTNSGGINVTGNILHSFSLNSPSTSAASHITGIYYSGTTASLTEVSKNFIHSFNVFAANINVTHTGIDFAAGTSTIANNMIRLGIRPDGTSLTTDITIRGISSNSGSAANNFYFNSIYIGGTGVTASTKPSFAFTRTATSGTYDIRNNILVNNRSNAAGSGLHYALYFANNSAGALVDYNIYSYSGTGGLFAYDGTSFVLTYQPSWLPSDLHSFAVDPLFVDPTGNATAVNLHIQTGSTAEGTGIDIPAVTDDFDNQIRASLSPADIGADAGNYALSGIDVGIIDLLSPAANGCYTGTQPVIVRLKNFSSNPIDFSTTNVTINVTATGTMPYTGSIVLSTGTLAAGATMDVTLPTAINMSANGTYVFNAGTVAAGDLNGFNNAIVSQSRSVLNLGGSYPVGAGQAAFGGFNTLSDAVVAWNNATCISSPVVFNLKDASYTSGTGELFPININANAAAGTNTLTIKPDAGVTAAITGSNTIGILILNGADRIIIDGSNNGTSTRDLTISNTYSGGSSSAVLLRSLGTGNGATNNIIRNSIISAGANTSGYSAISIGGATTATNGDDNDNNTIENNLITKAYYGIFAGATTAGLNDNLVIRNNVIGSSTAGSTIGFNAILLLQADGALISQNEVFGITNTLGFDAVFLNTGVVNSRITRNLIHDLKNTGTNRVAGITLNSSSTDNNTIDNNFIYNVINNGTGTASGAYGIYSAAGDDNKIYYNTITLSGDRDAVATTKPTTASAAIYVAANSNTLDVRNNILVNTMTAATNSPKSYALYNAGTASDFAVIDYNDFFVSGAQGVLGFQGADLTTLSSIQTAFGANSVNVEPVFVAPNNPHLVAGLNIALNNVGTPVTGVTNDIDNETRDASTPDIGADEFTPPPGVDISANTLMSPVEKTCYSAAETVKISILNQSSNTHDFSISPVTVTVNITGAATTTLTQLINTGTLASGDSLIVTLTPTLDMSAVGSYIFNVAANTPGDINIANNAMGTVTITAVAVTAGTVGSPNPQVCISGTPTLTLSGNAGGSIQWQESASATGPWTNVGTDSIAYVPSAAISSDMYYQAVVSCNASSATSNTLQIVVNNPQVLTTGPGTRCGPGTVILTATASSGATLNWYTSASGGVPVGTGNMFTTPIISSNTTYYVGATSGSGQRTVGISNITSLPGIGTTSSFTAGMEFDVPGSNATILSVDIYPTSAIGTKFQIEVRTSSGTVVATYQGTTTVSGTTTAPVAQTVPVNFVIPNGTGYVMSFNNGALSAPLTGNAVYPGALRNNPATGATFPYILPGTISITGGTTANIWYYFYKWQVIGACESALQPVLATIAPAPPLGLTGNTTICNNATQVLTVTTPLANFDSYVWSPITNLFTDAGATVPYTGGNAPTVYAKNPAGGSYTYVLTANNTSTSCQNIDSVQITVLPANISISASPAEICVSGPTTLSLNPGTGYGSSTFQWYSSTDGTTYTAMPGVTGGTYATAPLTSTTYYKVEIKDDAGNVCQQPTKTVIVNSPQVLTTTPAVNCGPGSMTLQATGSAGTQIRWYTTPTGGLPLATGNSFTTPSLSATTTYYVSAEDGIPPIGAGASNSTSNESPYYHFDGGKKSQYLVLASELSTRGFTAGNITSLGFNVVTVGTSYNNFSISMKNTTATAMSTTLETGLGTVYTAASVTPVVGLNLYTFQTPFNWDGTSNVIVEVCWSNNNTGGASTIVKRDATSFVSHAYFRADNQPQSVICSATTATGTTSSRPQIVFGAYCPSNRVAVIATVSGPTTITSQPTTQAACVGGSATVSVAATGANLTYQWRKNGVNISIPGATTSSLTITPLATTDAGLYDVIVSGTCGTVTSTAVYLVVATGNSWIGVTSTDWNIPTNWCGGVPTSATDITIPANTPYSPILASLGDVHSLTINNGATLTVTSTGTLDIFGNYTNNGTFSAASGLVMFKGTANQNIGSISAGTVLINGAGITLTGNMTVGNSLILTNGNITLGTNNIILNGSYTGSASSHIVTNGTGKAVSNNITTGPVTVPVGPTATSYNPVIISNGQGLNYSIQVATGINPGGVLNPARAINRTWTITPSSGVATPVNIVLQYSDADAIAPASPTLVMEAAVHNGTQWNVISPAAGITPSGLSAARQVGISTTQFGPTIIGNIGTLTNPLATPNVDPDINRVVLMPNVIYNNTILRVNSRRSMKIVWNVIDAQGRVVMRFQNQVYAGQTDIPLNFGHLATGNYFIIGNSEKGKTQLLKFIRQ